MVAALASVVYVPAAAAMALPVCLLSGTSLSGPAPCSAGGARGRDRGAGERGVRARGGRHGNALSARRFGERNWHAAAPTALTGAAFMLVPLGVRRGGPFTGIALIVVAAMGAWAVSGAPPVPMSDRKRCVRRLATMSEMEGGGLLRAFSVMSVTVSVSNKQTPRRNKLAGALGVGAARDCIHASFLECTTC